MLYHKGNVSSGKQFVDRVIDMISDVGVIYGLYKHMTSAEND